MDRNLEIHLIGGGADCCVKGIYPIMDNKEKEKRDEHLMSRCWRRTLSNGQGYGCSV